VRVLEGGEDWVELEAVLNSPQRLPLAFKVAGRVEALRCEEGGFVSPGDELPVGRLEIRDYEIGLRGAQATLGRAEAALRRAQGVGVPHARRELDRGRAVAAAGVIPERDLDGLSTLLDDMRAQAGEASAAVAQARVLVEQAEAALADTVIAAPFDGLVVKRMVEAGMLVGPGTPACVIEAIDPLDVVAGLPGRLLPQLDRTRTPRVTVADAGDRELDGVLEAVAWAGDVQTGTFPIKIRIANPDRVLRSGMRARVRLPLRRGDARPGETLYEIPLETLVSAGGRRFVFAPADGERTSVVRVPVEVRELGRDGVARVIAAFPGPLLAVTEGQYALLERDGERLPVREVAPP
jgi:RND family efflux transporter MFP subunit